MYASRNIVNNCYCERCARSKCVKIPLINQSGGKTILKEEVFCKSHEFEEEKGPSSEIQIASALPQQQISRQFKSESKEEESDVSQRHENPNLTDRHYSGYMGNIEAHTESVQPGENRFMQNLYSGSQDALQRDPIYGQSSSPHNRPSDTRMVPDISLGQNFHTSSNQNRQSQQHLKSRPFIILRSSSQRPPQQSANNPRRLLDDSNFLKFLEREGNKQLFYNIKPKWVFIIGISPFTYSQIISQILSITRQRYDNIFDPNIRTTVYLVSFYSENNEGLALANLIFDQIIEGLAPGQNPRYTDNP